jgi:macrodomain Ter protein organizer (MatP/YcbG family)
MADLPIQKQSVQLVATVADTPTELQSPTTMADLRIQVQSFQSVATMADLPIQVQSLQSIATLADHPTELQSVATMADHPIEMQSSTTTVDTSTENLAPEPPRSAEASKLSNRFDRLPNKEASPREVRQWIKGWFKQQGVTEYDATIRRLTWEGAMLRTLRWFDIVWEMEAGHPQDHDLDLADKICFLRQEEKTEEEAEKARKVGFYYCDPYFVSWIDFWSRKVLLT